MARTGEARLDDADGQEGALGMPLSAVKEAGVERLHDRQAREAERIAEALVFASAEPVAARRLPRSARGARMSMP